MSKGINKSFLLGNVGKDPEIRSTTGGSLVASFSLATADRQKDGQGNWQDKTEWHNLDAFNHTAEIVRDYVKKGTQLFIEGKIQTRSWDDKGDRPEEVQDGDLRLRPYAAGRWTFGAERQRLCVLDCELRSCWQSRAGRLFRPGHH